MEELSVGREAQKCVQRSLTCVGCERPIVPGEMMIQVGSGWSHTDAGCELAGEARHQAKARAELRESAIRPSALGESTGPGPARSTAGHTVAKRAQELNNMYSSDRVWPRAYSACRASAASMATSFSATRASAGCIGDADSYPRRPRSA